MTKKKKHKHLKYKLERNIMSLVYVSCKNKKIVYQ